MGYPGDIAGLHRAPVRVATAEPYSDGDSEWPLTQGTPLPPPTLPTDQLSHRRPRTVGDSTSASTRPLSSSAHNTLAAEAVPSIITGIGWVAGGALTRLPRWLGGTIWSVSQELSSPAYPALHTTAQNVTEGLAGIGTNAALYHQMGRHRSMFACLARATLEEYGFQVMHADRGTVSREALSALANGISSSPIGERWRTTRARAAQLGQRVVGLTARYASWGRGDNYTDVGFALTHSARDPSAVTSDPDGPQVDEIATIPHHAVHVVREARDNALTEAITARMSYLLALGPITQIRTLPLLEEQQQIDQATVWVNHALRRAHSQARNSIGPTRSEQRDYATLTALVHSAAIQAISEYTVRYAISSRDRLVVQEAICDTVGGLIRQLVTLNTQGTVT